MSASSVQALAERKNRQVSEHLNTQYQSKKIHGRDLEFKNANICVPRAHAGALCVLSLEGGWQVL